MSKPGTSEQGGRALEISDRDRHRLLASDRRIATFDILASVEDSVSIDDLATMVARQETDGLVPDEETITFVAVTLHHLHLPKMDDFGVVDYDPESMEITPSHRVLRKCRPD